MWGLSWLLGRGFGMQRRAYERGLARAEPEIAERRALAALEGYAAGQAQGTLDGRRCGESLGESIGRKEGRDRAYYEFLSEAGLVARAPTEWQVPSYRVDLGPHANIYDEGDAYAVRVIVNGVRLDSIFLYERTKSANNPERIKALVEALRFRRGVCATDGNLPMWCRTQFDVLYNNRMNGLPRNETVRQAALALTLDFHRWLLTEDSETAYRMLTPATPSQFMGEDPAARFPAANPEKLDEMLPWDDWPQWLEDLTKHFGLEHRATRDLLLLTAKDLDEVDGVGPRRLAKLRALLAQHGLALWGDPLPTAGIDRGQREARAITLD